MSPMICPGKFVQGPKEVSPSCLMGRIVMTQLLGDFVMTQPADLGSQFNWKEDVINVIARKWEGMVRDIILTM